MNGLYICVNGNSENFGQYTGICCEDDCENGVEMAQEQLSEII